MMTRKSLRLALIVIATLVLGVSSGQAARATSPTKHKRSSGTKASPSAAAKSGGIPKSSSGAKATTTGHSKAGVGKTSPSGASKSRTHAGKKSSGGRQRGQMAPAPERISEIQQALAKNGAFAGTPSGKWDDSTVEAMRKFQAARGLNPTGKLDAQTLNHLGLGSPTAGVAPPAPMVRTSATALPADIQQ